MHRFIAACCLVVVLGACTPDTPPSSPDGLRPQSASAALATWAAEPIPPVLASRRIFQPQLFVTDDGGLLFVWREKAQSDSDVYAVRRLQDGTFTDPVRLNEEPDSVESWNHDENRASVALGPGGRVAVGWNSADGNVRIATSVDHGVTFAPSIQLNQDVKPAYHAFPTLGFDASGVLHTAWIDARAAGRPRAEEPADLYYARLEGEGDVVEQSLTAEQEGSVCGCCRMHMEITPDQHVLISYRYATTDGYRDIQRITGTREGMFSAPERLGPPMWELRGCPSAGPLTVDGVTLWNEASTKKWRTLSANSGDGSYSVVLESDGDWSVRSAPRRVAGSGSEPPLVLVPGRSSGKILRADRGVWSTVLDDLPAWATSAVLTGGQLLLLGSEDGEARLASRTFGAS